MCSTSHWSSFSLAWLQGLQGSLQGGDKTRQVCLVQTNPAPSRAAWAPLQDNTAFQRLQNLSWNRRIMSAAARAPGSGHPIPISHPNISSHYPIPSSHAIIPSSHANISSHHPMPLSHYPIPIFHPIILCHYPIPMFHPIMPSQYLIPSQYPIPVPWGWDTSASLEWGQISVWDFLQWEIPFPLALPFPFPRGSPGRRGPRMEPAAPITSHLTHPINYGWKLAANTITAPTLQLLFGVPTRSNS